MPTVNQSINWAQLPAPSSGVDAYMRGAQFRQQQEVGQRQAQIQQMQIERLKERSASELAAADQGREYMANRAVLESVNKLGAIAQQNPQMYPGAYKAEVTKLQQMLPPQFTKDLNPDAPLPAEQLAPIRQSVEQNLQRLSTPAPKPQPFNADQVWAANRVVQDTGNQMLQNPLAAMKANPEQFERYRNEFNAMREKEAKARGTNVVVEGRDPATTSRRTAHQKTIDDARETLATIQDIKTLGDPGQYLGWLNRAEFWGKDKVAQAGLIGALPPEEREQFERAAQFRAIVDKYRATEFNRLIGAAQTTSEVKNLVNSILNADMNEVQFRAALKNLDRTTQRALQFSQEALDKGYDLGTADYNRHMESAFKGARRNDRAALFEQMAGRPKEEIIDAAMAEGIMTEDEARRLLEQYGG